MRNRIIPILIIFCMALSLCSCSKTAPVTVNGTKISKGVYTYFFDCAKSENPNMSEAEIKENAYSRIAEYIAVNSEFNKKQLTLSVDEKTEISEAVNVYWQYFSKHYEDIGVSKQDYYQVKTSESYREKLMEQYYSAEGEAPVTDKELKDYFNSNFIAFRAVTGFLTTVDDENNTVSLPAKDRDIINSAFNKMAAEINEGVASLEDVAGYAENTTITNETVVISKDSTDYPDGFFENVMKLQNDKAGSFVIGDYIFAVQRNDINSKELDLFSKYKSDCLKALKSEEFDSIVDNWSKYYMVEEK